LRRIFFRRARRCLGLARAAAAGAAGSGAGQWPPSWQRDRPIKRRFGSNDSGLSNFHGRDRPIKRWFSGNDGGLSNFHGPPDISRLPDATRYLFGELALSINND